MELFETESVTDTTDDKSLESGPKPEMCFVMSTDLKLFHVNWYWYHRLGFCLCEDRPSILIKSQWNIPPLAWIAYRMMMAFWLLGVLIVIILDWQKFHPGWMFFIYLTNWGFLVLVIDYLFRAILVASYFSWLQHISVSERKPLMFNISWMLNTVSSGVALGISLAYFSLLYRGGRLDFEGFQTHVMNLVITVVDWILIATPFHLAHFFPTFLFESTYAVFSIVYFITGGKNHKGSIYIYPFLRWDKPEVGPIIWILITAMSFSSALILFVMVRLRRWLAGWKYPRQHVVKCPPPELNLPEVPEIADEH